MLGVRVDDCHLVEAEVPLDQGDRPSSDRPVPNYAHHVQVPIHIILLHFVPIIYNMPPPVPILTSPHPPTYFFCLPRPSLAEEPSFRLII